MLYTVSSEEKTATRILEAALKLVTRRGGGAATMAEIAKAAGVSRQALYLHYADRAALFLALVRYADDKAGLAEALKEVTEAPSGVAALAAAVRVQTAIDPRIYAVARALDSLRAEDAAAERAWQDRMEVRLRGCRGLIARLQQDGRLRRGLDPAAAADLLWAILSLKTWEDLVRTRGWTAEQYIARVTALLSAALVEP
jgi:AcrR family transcriptional regulator